MESKGIRMAKLLVNRALKNKRHITEHGKYKLILGDDFYYRFYVDSILSLITCDSAEVVKHLAYYIDRENLMGDIK